MSNLQMKVDRRFKYHIKKSANRLFEIIELNVDEPIIFQTGKRKKQVLESKVISKDEKRKIMLVVPR